MISFQSALALQCFINEYIFPVSKEEKLALEKLEMSIVSLLNAGLQPSTQALLCLSSYRSIEKYSWCDAIKIHEEFAEVFHRQVLDVRLENDIKKEIRTLASRNFNNISAEVKAQYEENPYPRWVYTKLTPRQITIRELICEENLKIVEHQIMSINEPSVLIAGCGTGQQPIEEAVRLKNAKVTAVDLSYASLAYAIRKTRELEIQNIDYIQADILELSSLDQNYDIIESSGVLHHMQDPLEGWKILVDLLKEGGLMNIGLYSRLARTNVTRIRSEFGEPSINTPLPSMRKIREKIKTSRQKHHCEIKNSNDFYSSSGLRDLLFHVKEHQFDLLQVKRCLLDLGLQFCGFSDQELVRQFKHKFSGTDDEYDLEKWHEFELLRPKSFVGMYQFWCQKI